MIKNILSFIWKALGIIFAPACVTIAVLLVLGQLKTINNNVNALSSTVETTAVNQATLYDSIIEIDAALAGADINVSNQLKQLKLDEAKENSNLIKTLYAVDKNSITRSQGIVDGVNKMVGGISYLLQKPSYTYLKSITVKIIARNVNADTLPDGKKGWMGTGVIIAIDKDFTYILTCRHVVGESDSPYDPTKYHYYIKDGNDKYTFTPIKVSKDENVDLALIRINGHIDGKRAVRGFGDVSEQDPVYMVGMDLGRPFFYSEGTVAGFDDNNGDELVVGMPSGPGNSGSGIINKDGKLVGILYAGSIIDQEGIDELDISHGLCVPIKAIRLFLAGYIEE